MARNERAAGRGRRSTKNAARAAAALKGGAPAGSSSFVPPPKRHFFVFRSADSAPGPSQPDDRSERARLLFRRGEHHALARQTTTASLSRARRPAVTTKTARRPGRGSESRDGGRRLGPHSGRVLSDTQASGSRRCRVGIATAASDASSRSRRFVLSARPTTSFASRHRPGFFPPGGTRLWRALLCHVGRLGARVAVFRDVRAVDLCSRRW
jgi:hypothetical protein